jgi:signal transduction histidine kinase
MRVSRRTKAMAFFIVLGACLVALAVALNVTWVITHWRRVVPLIIGVILFGLLIAGLVMNTIFLVREVRRNEQQDAFFNAVTHELKTPIASIRLYLETLESRQLGESQRRDFYRIMLEDTGRLLGTVEQVLKASELRHGTARKDWQEVDFSMLVQEAIDLARLRHHLSECEIRFGTEPPAGISVLGEREDLRTAVFNLLDNAIKYSGERKSVVVDLLTPNLDRVMLRVRDEGSGIPRRELKRIFRRFYRMKPASMPQVSGTGLGLFIVRSVARRHGGDISADSAGEGLGSTFTLRLPRMYRP